MLFFFMCFAVGYTVCGNGLMSLVRCFPVLCSSYSTALESEAGEGSEASQKPLWVTCCMLRHESMTGPPAACKPGVRLDEAYGAPPWEPSQGNCC